MRVLICGDRNWTDREVIRRVLTALRTKKGQRITIVEGGAKGADRIAAEEAALLGYTVEEHPAEWEKYGRAAGPIRNQQMIDSGVVGVIAFHADLTKSKGTASMVAVARVAGVPVTIYTGVTMKERMTHER